MRTLGVGLFAAAAMLMVGVMGCDSSASQEGGERRQVTSADLEQWNEELSIVLLDAIEQWWRTEGATRYPGSRELAILQRRQTG